MPALDAVDVRKVSILGKESIHCGFHLIPYIVRTVLDTIPSSTYVLFTDSNVGNLHLALLRRPYVVQGLLGGLADVNDVHGGNR